MSISAEGRAANRESAPVARGEVRWYRAARYGRGRGAIATSAGRSAVARPVEVSPVPLQAIRSPRRAIAAYLRAMREAA